MKDLEDVFNKINLLLESNKEWLSVYSSGNTFNLRNDEIELNIQNSKILIGFINEKGFQTWRIVGFSEKNNEILLHLTRNFEKENEKVRLVPHISTSELSASIEIAKLEKANQIAAFIKESLRLKKLVRVSLNKENGRFAQIILENPQGNQTAFLSDVSKTATSEILISTAIYRLSKLELRKKKPIEEISIAAEKKSLKKLRKLHALLNEKWKSKIKLWEISQPDEKTQNQKIVLQNDLKISDLWREKPKKIQPPENTKISRTAREIIKLAPEKIDLLFTKQGETLRFEGLPFARVRQISGEEKCWFGIERDRRILNENSREEFFELLENLEIYRRFDAPNKRHALFQLASEAWLEAVLRRNIKQLDANLILSPLHNQFRAERDKIDLLAMRKDGRLIIIELKVAPDREMIFQAVDYWRKIELSRRKGNLQNIKLFGDLAISDAPTLVYLVAPTLSFHRDFSFFAKTVASEIEIFRFNLNENWRENLQVMKVEEI